MERMQEFKIPFLNGLGVTFKESEYISNRCKMLDVISEKNTKEHCIRLTALDLKTMGEELIFLAEKLSKRG